MIGVDGSEEMLAQAAEKCREVEGDRPHLSAPGHAQAGSLRHRGCLPSAVWTASTISPVPATVQRTFQRLHLFIAPGGLLVFDINTVDKLAALDGQVFLDETEDAYCVWRAEYQPGATVHLLHGSLRPPPGRCMAAGAGDPPGAGLYQSEELHRLAERRPVSAISALWGELKLRRPHGERAADLFFAASESEVMRIMSRSDYSRAITTDGLVQAAAITQPGPDGAGPADPQDPAGGHRRLGPDTGRQPP